MISHVYLVYTHDTSSDCPHNSPANERMRERLPRRNPPRRVESQTLVQQIRERQYRLALLILQLRAWRHQPCAQIAPRLHVYLLVHVLRNKSVSELRI